MLTPPFAAHTIFFLVRQIKIIYSLCNSLLDENRELACLITLGPLISSFCFVYQTVAVPYKKFFASPAGRERELGSDFMSTLYLLAGV
jgi:hypothetical protein